MLQLTTLQIETVTPKEWPDALGDAVPGRVAEIWAQWGVTALAASALMATAIAVLRFIGGMKARRRRRAVVMKPSSQFDPSAEEVLRFCGQLLRVHSATARWTVPRSTRMIRIKLVSAGEGRMAQLLEGPAAAEQILRHRGFAQVELADPDMVLAARPPAPGSEATEEESAEPIPLRTTTAVMDDVDRDERADRDPLGPDVGISAEDWLDTDHEGHLDAAPDALEWMHPEDQRLYPVPDHPEWDCLDDRSDR